MPKRCCLLVSTKEPGALSTKFRVSDLVPAGFAAERITHIDDYTRILLPELALPRRVQHGGEYCEPFEVAIAATSRTFFENGSAQPFMFVRQPTS